MEVIKVAMTPHQSTIYNWVKETGTLRSDPDTYEPGKALPGYVPLEDKCLELRKVSPYIFLF